MRITKRFCLLLVLACVAASAYTGNTSPLPFVQGSWTLVLLPDTQHYARSRPKTFASQTRWIANHAADRNIKFVMTEGDVTNDNTPAQWANAKAAFGLLDGKVPYALQLGNHDYRGKPLPQRATLANRYFPPELVKSSPAYGGAFETGKLDNAYYLFTAGGRDWVALSLEFAPRDEVVKWANVILDKFSDRSAMICTHAYIDVKGRRFNHRSAGGRKVTAKMTGLNDGQQLWEKLVSKHANVVFVFCGHVGKKGAARLASKGEAGNTVHEILSDYQTLPNGGDGFLRLVEFLPDGRSVQVKTYSTSRDDYKTDPGNQFTLQIAPAARKANAAAAR